MVQFNFFRREVNCKIVYYGPGLSGKTTNLEVVHHKTPQSNRGELTSIATEQDRTLFFDFMPIDLGTVAGMKTKLRLFTVPGQVYYNSTRKLVLQGADGIIFVADSQESKVEENIYSLKNLEENLSEHGMNIRDLPVIIQWNKRDMPSALPVEELEEKINYLGAPTFTAVALTGEGVFPTLKKCAALVLESVAKKANQAHQRSGVKMRPGSQQVPPKPMAPGGLPNRRSQATPHARRNEPQQGKSSQVSRTPSRPQQPGVKPTQSSHSPSPVFTPSSGSSGSQSPRPVFRKFKKILDKDKGGTRNS